MGEPAYNLQVSTTREPLHETGEPSIRPLTYFLVGLGAAIVAVCVIIGAFFFILNATINEKPIERRTADSSATTVTQPPLQVLPRADIDAIRERDETALHTTAWIDRERGLARVPIEAAMVVVAKSGLPKWPPAAAEPANGEPRPVGKQ